MNYSLRYILGAKNKLAAFVKNLQKKIGAGKPVQYPKIIIAAIAIGCKTRRNINIAIAPGHRYGIGSLAGILGNGNTVISNSLNHY